jgi:hypothetical protein
MKRRITIQDLQQLTPEQQQKLREWWKPEDLDIAVDLWCDLMVFPIKSEDSKIYEWPHRESEINGQKYKLCETELAGCLPLLNIGQMIELLGDDWYYSFFGTNTWVDGACLNVRYEGELCDALWEAVKGDL